MKIIAIAPSAFLIRPFLGDATQMRKTINELRKIDNIDVTCAYYPYGATYELMEQEQLKTVDDEVIRWEDIYRDYDVAHMFLTPHAEMHHFAKHLKRMPVLVSTVYWNNNFRELVSVRNGAERKLLKDSWKNVFNQIRGKKSDLFYDWCSGILPNTWAEGNCVRKYFNFASHVVSIPIPNALSYIPDLSNLQRPDYLPEGDYIVCPGVFHWRKNQLGLIRALKGHNIPIVFMGSPFPGIEKYYDDCRKAADENFYFIGFKSSEEDEYWSVLKYARAAVLPSDCETPGISMLEAVAAGARPIITIHGGTQEYFGLTAAYLNPLSESSIRNAVIDGWNRGRLFPEESDSVRRFTWGLAAKLTAHAYDLVRENWKQSAWNSNK